MNATSRPSGDRRGSNGTDRRYRSSGRAGRGTGSSVGAAIDGAAGLATGPVGSDGYGRGPATESIAGEGLPSGGDGRAAEPPARAGAAATGRRGPDVADGPPGSLRLPRLPVRAHLGRPPRARVRRAVGAPGRRRGADRRPDGSRPRPIACRSSPGSPYGSRRARPCSTASWWWSTRSGRADDDALRDAAERQARAGPSRYLVFDVLHLDGKWLLNTPLEKRRVALRRVLRPGDEVVVVPAIAGEGRALHAAVTAQGIAGVLARRRTSPYLPGVHSALWRSIMAGPRSEGEAAPAASGRGGRRDGRHRRARPGSHRCWRCSGACRSRRTPPSSAWAVHGPPSRGV